MIGWRKLDQILGSYDFGNLRIGTIGSHTALNIFKGAKDEGLKTVCVCKSRDKIVYERFKLADEFILVESFENLLDHENQEKLRKLNTILIPHGSFTAYIDPGKIMDELEVPIFGNRRLLEWEVDRDKQRIWLEKAGLTLPKTLNEPKEITQLTIVKFPGAMGGRGYFLVKSPDEFSRKLKEAVDEGLILKNQASKPYMQEYIFGVGVYSHHFRSIVDDEVELLGFDRRYESTVDAIGRIPAEDQLKIKIPLTYTVVGNFPIVLRESLLPKYLEMGDNVVKVSEEIAPPGIIGPFCLETVVTEKLQIYVFEISARIVAGMSVGIGTSPYAYLKYGREMYMGRRIALEIKKAVASDNLKKVLT
ncbi:MAG: formate--phosphoribosylaminoimidazolecarboxamide ligase [Candidatus Bathyarchaeota archaeon]